jgi:hypothetical protein
VERPEGEFLVIRIVLHEQDHLFRHRVFLLSPQ